MALEKKCEVLVVDDDQAVRNLLAAALPRQGLTVRLAASGAEALTVYRQHRDTIALVLLDVLMPGMDGPQTLQALREVDPEVRCCFMSGSTGSYTTEDLLRTGALEVVQKPFGIVALVQKLRQLMSP